MLSSSDLKQRLISLGVASAKDIVGCSTEEIERLQKTSKMRLPDAYLQFLRVAGKRAGRFLLDVEIFYDDVDRLNQKAFEKLELWEEGKLRLPDNSFVFSMRYGEQFMFFVVDGQRSDPEIFHYYEGSGFFKKVANSFWEVIEGEILDLERFKNNHPDAPYWK